MWKVAFVTLLFFGLGVGPTLAGDAHEAADRYLQSDAKVSDRDVALAILCLAAGLPEQSAQMGPGDREAVTKIQRLAGKSLEDAMNATEELEETAKLFLMLRGEATRPLTQEQVDELRKRFG
jgi:hypothetical protein